MKKLNLNEIYENLLENEVLSEENTICNNCLNVTKRIKSLEIKEFPNYLIFNLKKKIKNNNFITSNSKNKIKNIISCSSINDSHNKEEFPFWVDLKCKLDDDDYHQKQKRFELFSVVSSNNEDLTDGKFKLICRNGLNSNWIEHDDESGKPISENNIFNNTKIKP